MVKNEIKNKIIKDLKKFVVTIAAVAAGIFITTKILGTSCYLKLLVGIPCPGCGMTRALKLVLRFKFIEAFYMHPMIYLTGIWLLLYIVTIYFFPKNKNPLLIYSAVCVILFIFVYIYRMEYLYPNVEPMEYFENNILKYIRSM